MVTKLSMIFGIFLEGQEFIILEGQEDIYIDFTEFEEGGLEFLPAFIKDSSCKSYLLVFPGKLIADIYDKYGDRLLEQNVRTFLQFRGGVNKSILTPSKMNLKCFSLIIMD